MTFKTLLVAAGAASLIAGAAYAQDAETSVTTDENGVTSVTTTVETPGLGDPTVTTSANSALASGMPASSIVTTTDGVPGTLTTKIVTNGPVPDTPENRARYGRPLSHAGKMTAPAGN
ncbi:MAG TPA: hypothetical protein VF138_07970 [Caulobacteraceae bacterium]